MGLGLKVYARVEVGGVGFRVQGFRFSGLGLQSFRALGFGNPKRERGKRVLLRNLEKHIE